MQLVGYGRHQMAQTRDEQLNKKSKDQLALASHHRPDSFVVVAFGRSW
jgi:hypothetical protein